MENKELLTRADICKLTGLKARQVQMLSESGAIKAADSGIGRGSWRRYDHDNLLYFAVAKELLDIGLPHERIRELFSCPFFTQKARDTICTFADFLAEFTLKADDFTGFLYVFLGENGKLDIVPFLRTNDPNRLPFLQHKNGKLDLFPSSKVSDDERLPFPYGYSEKLKTSKDIFNREWFLMINLKVVWEKLK